MFKTLWPALIPIFWGPTWPACFGSKHFLHWSARAANKYI